MSTTADEDGRMLTVSGVVDEDGQPGEVMAWHEQDTRVTAVNPQTQEVHVWCPYCGAHHAHGVSLERDFTGPGDTYVAYRVPHCLGERPSGTCYRIYDPDGLVGLAIIPLLVTRDDLVSAPAPPSLPDYICTPALARAYDERGRLLCVWSTELDDYDFDRKFAQLMWRSGVGAVLIDYEEFDTLAQAQADERLALRDEHPAFATRDEAMTHWWAQLGRPQRQRYRDAKVLASREAWAWSTARRKARSTGGP